MSTVLDNLWVFCGSFYNKSQGVPSKISNQIYINASNNNICKNAPIGPISLSKKPIATPRYLKIFHKKCNIKGVTKTITAKSGVEQEISLKYPLSRQVKSGITQ